MHSTRSIRLLSVSVVLNMIEQLKREPLLSPFFSIPFFDSCLSISPAEFPDYPDLSSNLLTSEITKP